LICLGESKVNSTQGGVVVSVEKKLNHLVAALSSNKLLSISEGLLSPWDLAEKLDTIWVHVLSQQVHRHENTTTHKTFIQQQRNTQKDKFDFRNSFQAYITS
jgi:hypothetical protein